MSLALPYRLGREPADSVREDYPLAFWCLVFFTFIVFIAPQNIVTALQPLHLAKASAIVALAAYVIQRLSRYEPVLPIGTEFRLLALFVFLAILSIPFSRWPGGSLDVVTGFYLKSVLVSVLLAQLLTSPERFRQMLRYILVFCALAAVIALVGYARGHVVEGYRMAGAWSGINANPNDFALTLNIMLPFAIALSLLSAHPLARLAVALFLVLAVSAILSTFSRGGFITLASILVLLLVKRSGRGQGLRYVFPVLLVGLAAAALVPAGYETRLESIFDASKDRYGSAGARLTSMKYALELVMEHPLLGVGIGMNILALNAKGLWWTHVHNVYLQIASEVGLPALVVFLLLLARLLRGLRRIQSEFQGDVRRREVVVLASACEVSLLAFCVAAMFHPVAYHVYFYYVAGFALALKGIAERAAENAESAGDPGPQWTGLSPWRAGPSSAQPLFGGPHA